MPRLWSATWCTLACLWFLNLAQILARDDCLFKAPEPTQLKKNTVVRVAFDDTAIEGTMRWQYGKVVKVFTGGELVDINLDSGEELRATPTFDVNAVQ